MIYHANPHHISLPSRQRGRLVTLRIAVRSLVKTLTPKLLLDVKVHLAWQLLSSVYEYVCEGANEKML